MSDAALLEEIKSAFGLTNDAELKLLAGIPLGFSRGMRAR